MAAEYRGADGPEPRVDRSQGAFWALFAVLFVAAAVPLALTAVLPLVDYPNHLARMAVLHELGQGSPLDAFYAAAWHAVPNLAMDAVVPPLLSFLPLAWAGKLFVALCFFLIAAGAATLNRVLFGRWSVWACLAFLLLYGRILLWGFLNFLAGAGLVLFALAVWIALGERARPLRLAVGALLALALYFAHLMAFGVYAVLLGGFELGRRPRAGRSRRDYAVDLGLAALSLAPPLLVMALAGPGEAGGGVSFAPLRKLDLLFSVFDDYSRPFDIACFVFAAAGLALAYVKGWVRLHPALAMPLALLVVVYVVMPNQLFTASGVDRRLPLMIGLVLIAGSAWAGSARIERRFLASALILFLLRTAVVAWSWHGSGALYDRLLTGLDRVPEGSRIALAFPDQAIAAGGTPLLHLPVLAVARRHAFVPTLFTAAAQQPVAFTPPYRALAEALSARQLWAAFVDGRGLGPEEERRLHDYDFVVFLDRRPLALASTAGLEPTFLTPRFQLYRVRPAAR